MRKLITIHCENSDTGKQYLLGTSLHEIIADQKIKSDYPILGAFANNEVEELSYEIFKAKKINFFDITHKDGMRMYVRSLYFVLLKAVKDLYPETNIMVGHSISNGYFCELDGKHKEITGKRVEQIKKRMLEIIKQDIPFVRKEILKCEAVKMFENSNAPEKARLFRQGGTIFTEVYSLDNITDFFYGYLIPSTGLLTNFEF